MKERVKVDIWSDIACPWCCLGKRRFDKAPSKFVEPIEQVAREWKQRHLGSL